MFIFFLVQVVVKVVFKVTEGFVAHRFVMLALLSLLLVLLRFLHFMSRRFFLIIVLLIFVFVFVFFLLLRLLVLGLLVFFAFLGLSWLRPSMFIFLFVILSVFSLWLERLSFLWLSWFIETPIKKGEFVTSLGDEFLINRCRSILSGFTLG